MAAGLIQSCLPSCSTCWGSQVGHHAQGSGMGRPCSRAVLPLSQGLT